LHEPNGGDYFGAVLGDTWWLAIFQSLSSRTTTHVSRKDTGGVVSLTGELYPATAI
jgi:hypothetical protein